jgi:phenylalanyl-tRNA synthetase beta chain
VLDQIWAVATPLLESVTLTDLYLCKSADNPTRNATFHFVYRDREKTISQAAADAEHAHILNEVTKFISP